MEPQPADSLVDLLDQLQDITEPPPVSMWPATWGWAIVGALLVAGLVIGLAAYYRHRRATAWRRAALAELHGLSAGLAVGDPAALPALQVLLRRVALVTRQRAQVAPLSGDGWTRFLADTGGSFGPLARDLALAPYRPVRTFDGKAAVAAARQWIRRQHA